MLFFYFTRFFTYYWLILPYSILIYLIEISCHDNRISVVMVRVLVWIAVDRGFKSRWGQTKEYKIGIGCLSAKHSALRWMSKDMWPQNQDNVSEWDNMSIHRLSYHY
jgi:hypothetical protein